MITNLLQTTLLISMALTVSSFRDPVRLEWSLGSPLPVSKMLNSGTEQDLYCSLDYNDHQFPVLLQCPMHKGICMENCNPNEENLHISCSNMTNNNMIIFHYRIKVLKSYEGLWKCQYRSESSRSVELTVTNKPYITSFTATPNPVWKGSQINVTCEAMPMPGINGIQFYRQFHNNTTAIISNEHSQRIDQPYDSVIINSATPDRDDRIQCMVFTNNGIITTKVLKINIFYFPTRLRLTTFATDDSFSVGFLITFHCSAEGGNPKPVLYLHRQRVREEPERLIDTNVLLSKSDNGAAFYCEMKKVAGVKSNLKSNIITTRVKYPPENIYLTEESNGQLRESQIQSFVCLSKSGSEPSSKIEWSMTDPMGRRVSNIELKKIIEKIDTTSDSEQALKESIKMTILRNLNGYSISCSIIYEGKNLFAKKRTLKVAFAPNSIEMNSNPLGPILQGTSVVLTCSTGTANPPSKIQWFKTKPGQKSEDLTPHSNLDLMPANYSGVAISSTLSIHDVTKDDHGTLYKCIVSHAYIVTEITKEYFLNVLFPPVVQVYSYPQPIEEGEQVFLHCRTSGGNPNNFSLYRFQWRFCIVNNTYQLPTSSELSDKPTSDIRKHCSQNPYSSGYQQLPTLNLTTVSNRQRGWYSCLVHSPGGLAQGYSFLNVLYPPILIKQGPDRIYHKTSTDITMKFQVLSNPLDINVKWFFRPQKKSVSGAVHDPLYDTKMQSIPSMKKPIIIEPYGRMESILLDNFTVYLLIRSLTYQDYGDYYCEVGNRVGKRWIQFQLNPSNDITIPETSISIQFSGRKVIVHYEPPTSGHFTHLILRICSLEGAGNCKDMHISNPLSGKASTTLHRSPDTFSYRILVYNGSSLLQITNTIQKSIALQAGNWVEMSFEMMVAVIIGVIGIFILLFVALVTIILLKCRQNKSKDLLVENNSILTSNSHRRFDLQDYFLLNSSANTSLMKNGCHCFPNYPMELRSDNGSDHSAPSQGVYHPIMMRRKMRDNGEMSSIHSGGSCQNPDVVLTEKTSIGSGNNQNFNGTSQFNSIGSSTPTKVTFLSGRLHSLDNQRQELNLQDDYTMTQNMVFAAVDDGMNQTRLIPISAKNLHSEYPLYFQMNNQQTPKPYDSNPSPLYSTSLPHCIKPSCSDNYRENSSSTNTDSNQYSATQDPSAVEIANGPVDIRNGD